MGATPTLARPTVGRPAPQTSRRDAPFRAAEILGRMMAFFEDAEGSSDAARHMACTLLGAEVDRWHQDGVGEKGYGRFRGAVLTAAVTLLEASGGSGVAPGSDDEAAPSTPSTRYGRNLDRSYVEAGRIHDRVHRVLDPAAPHREHAVAQHDAPVAVALAHLLRGPERRMWSTERRSFAACVVRYLGGKG